MTGVLGRGRLGERDALLSTCPSPACGLLPSNPTTEPAPPPPLTTWSCGCVQIQYDQSLHLTVLQRRCQALRELGRLQEAFSVSARRAEGGPCLPQVSWRH